MRISLSKKISLGAMTVALTVLSLFAASVLPWSKIACLFLSSLFIYVLASEGLFVFSILAYIASGVLAYLFLPDKGPCFAYIALLGHYGIFRTFAEKRIKDKVLRMIFKLLYCNAFTLLCVFLVCFVFSIDISSVLPHWNIYIMLAALQAAFVLFDILYSLCCRFYDAVIRNSILPRR